MRKSNGNEVKKMTINTTCGKIAKHLEQLENTILSDEDIRTATKYAGILSKDNYLGDGGYLEELRYLYRCEGGWSLTLESSNTKRITLEISSMNYVEVSAAINKAVKQFAPIVEIVE